MESSLVVPVDPAGGGVFDVCQCLVGAVVEDRGADALVLVEPVYALHQGIVVGIPDAADRGPDALEVEVLGEPDRGVLRPGVGVVDQVRGQDRMVLVVALPDRHPQRCQDHVGGFAGRGVPGQDQLRVHVNDERGLFTVLWTRV